MNNNLIFITILLLMTVFPLAYKFLIFFKDFTSGSKYIREKLKSAEEKEKIRYWKRRQKMHYLRLLPFVNRKNVHKVYRFLKHSPKTEK